MSTHPIQREADWVLLEADMKPGQLEALEAEFHNPKVGSLLDAGAKLAPDVIVIKIEA